MKRNLSRLFNVYKNKSDESLMGLIMDQNAAAYEELYMRYKNQVVSFLYMNTRSEQNAQDICQEVFLKVYRFAIKFDQTRKFKPWLWTLVRNTMLDSFRKKNDLLYEDFLKEDDDYSFEVEDQSINIEESLMQKMEAQRLESLIKQLPANQKEVLIYQVLDDLNYNEISEITGKSVSSIKSLLFRARKNLIEVMEKENEGK